jgi:polygalacturonase
VSNILFTGNYIYGVDLNGITASDANAIRIKSDVDCGGKVDRVTYANTCITQSKHLIVLDTMYGSCDGTNGTPMFTNIVINGVLATNSVSSAYTRIRGLDSSHLIDAYLAHISLDKTTQSSDQDATVHLDASNITPSGTGISTSSFSISGSVPTCAF